MNGGLPGDPVRPQHSRATPPRLPALDAIKALACITIVWHHLVLYGPMSDVVQPHLPGLTDWLFDYGRMAVQVFLVVAGFLAADTLAPGSRAALRPVGQLLFNRYLRLVLPYAAALAVSVLVTMLLRPWFDHPALPAEPTWQQVLAHVLLLQDALGYEALSAGVWYVAIDLQLYASAVLILAATRQAPRHLAAGLAAALVVVLGAASLLAFNRRPALDFTALYFFGSYALGMLACWVARSLQAGHAGAAGLALIVMVVMGASALLLEFRLRIALAGLTALVLVIMALTPPRGRSAAWLQRSGLLALGRISYSVFLIHFPVVLLVNAVVNRFWPAGLAASVLGMLLAFVLSLLAGAALYRGIEARVVSMTQRQWTR